MTKLRVESLGGDAYQVTVSQDGRESVHEVTVSEEERSRYGGNAACQDLLRESFRFLLEREPAESILGSFGISAIERYFPEYPEEIRGRLA